MRLTLLGTGSAMPTGERAQAGYLIESGDRALLVDCGSGILHRLAQTPRGYDGVDVLLLSHHHVDHVADLLPLLKARWLADADPLEIVGPPGTEALLDDLLDIHEYLRAEVEFLARDVSPGRIDIAGWSVEAAETRHSTTCYAYRIAGETGDVTLSGDSAADPALIRFADGSSVLVHDCSFPDDVDVSNHPTPAQLGEVLAGADIGRVVLSHLYPHTEGRHREMRQSVRAAYDGTVEILDDRSTIEC